MPENAPRSGGGLGRAVLCLSPDDGMRSVVRALLEASGLAVVSEVERGLDALAATVEQQADVAVLHLGLVGTLGLRLIGLLQAVAPGVVIVAISPFDTLVQPALDAGAAAALTPAELHQLPRLFGELGLST